MGFSKRNIKQHLQNVKRSFMSSNFFNGKTFGLWKTVDICGESTSDVNNLIVQIQTIDSENAPKVGTLIDIEATNDNNNIQTTTGNYFDNLIEDDHTAVSDEGYDCIDGNDESSYGRKVDRKVVSLHSDENANDKIQDTKLLCDVAHADSQSTGFKPPLDDVYHLQFKTRCVDEYFDDHPEGIENAFVPFKVVEPIKPPPLIDIEDSSDAMDTKEDFEYESDPDMDILELLRNTAKVVRVSRAAKIGVNGRFRMTADGKLSGIRFVRPIQLK